LPSPAPPRPAATGQNLDASFFETPQTGEPFEAAGVALVAQAVFDAEWPVTQMHESAEKYMRRLDRVSGNGSADDDRGRIPVAPDPLPTDPPSGDVNALLLRARRLAGALRATLVR